MIFRVNSIPSLMQILLKKEKEEKMYIMWDYGMLCTRMLKVVFSRWSNWKGILFSCLVFSVFSKMNHVGKLLSKSVLLFCSIISHTVFSILLDMVLLFSRFLILDVVIFFLFIFGHFCGILTWVKCIYL